MKTALTFFLWVAMALPHVLAADIRQQAYQPVEGDVVFQSMSGNELGRVIEAATKSNYSHCGIVVKTGDKWMVLEAVGPVQETPLGGWIKRGSKGIFDVYRLDDRYRLKIPEFVAKARAYKGRPYDTQYEMDENKIYCSELVYKAFKKTTAEELGVLVPLSKLDWKDHEAFIRNLTGELPLNRLMITPVDLSRAKQLKLVYQQTKT